MANSLDWVTIVDPNVLLPLLSSRLPQSCSMYNQVLKHKYFQNCLYFYTLGKDTTDDTWILSNNIRKDYGSLINISAPISVVMDKSFVKPETKNAFAKCDVNNWDDSLVVIPIEKPISQMILDVSINEKGNVTEVHPCNFYYMETKNVPNLEFICPSDVEVRRLDPTKQEEKFIASSWKYTRSGSEDDIRQCIEAYPSAGVFCDGKCVAGVIITGYGIISSLYTLPEYRNKGFGKLAMQYLFRECAKEGCIPGYSVEKRNTRAIRFNEELGVKLVGETDWIKITKFEME